LPLPKNRAFSYLPLSKNSATMGVLKAAAFALALAGVKGDQAQCIIKGPTESGIKRSFGVSLEKCNNECKAEVYADQAGMAFQKAFTPVAQGKLGFCACALGRHRKLVLKVRPGTCTADNEGTQKDCWDVYKLFMKLADNVNLWTPNLECATCDGQCPEEIDMPRNIDAAEIARLNKLAGEGDADAIEMLAQIDHGRFKGMVITTNYEWRIGGSAHELPDSSDGSFNQEEDNQAWTECDKQCADVNGPGTQARTVECFADDVSVDKEECLGFFGYEPKASKECNTQVCKQWKCVGPGEDGPLTEYPAKDCGNVLPTSDTDMLLV